MAISFVNKSSLFVAGSGTVSPAIPASMQAGDLMILVVHSANETITGPTDWTAAPAFPAHSGTAERGTAATAGGVRVRVFARWWQSGDGAPTVADSGNLTAAMIFGFRGVDQTDPFDATPVGFNAAAATTHTLTGITTATANALVVHALALDLDSNVSGIIGAPSNANLTGLTEHHDQASATATGGGICVSSGTKATAGASGSTTTATGTSTAIAGITFALREAPITGSASMTLAAATVAATGSVPIVTPTLTQLYAGNFSSGTGPLTSSSIAVTAGDVLVVVSAGSVNEFVNSTYDTTETLADSGGNTWTKHIGRTRPVADWCPFITIWTTTVASTTSITVTADNSDPPPPDVESRTLFVYRAENVGGFGVMAEGDQEDVSGTGTSALSLTLSGAPAESSLVLAAVINSASVPDGTATDPGAGWTQVTELANPDPGWHVVLAQSRSGSTSTSVVFELDHFIAVAGVALELIGAPEEGGGGPEGTASLTTEAAVVSATGTVRISGVASVATAAASTSATGALSIAATASVAVSNAVSSGAALAIVGTSATSTADATVSSTIAPTPISGVASVAVADATASATGQVAIAGVASMTAAAATVSSAGAVALRASASVDVANAVSSGAALSIAGQVSTSAGDASVSSSGAASIRGTASVSADASASAAGTVALAATASLVLEGAVVSSEGSQQEVSTGELTATLADAAASASGKVTVAATATGNVDASTSAQGAVALRASASVDVANAVSAGAALSIVGQGSTATGDATVSSAGAVTVATAVAVGLEDASASSSARLAVRGEATVSVDASVSATMAEAEARVVDTIIGLAARRTGPRALGATRPGPKALVARRATYGLRAKREA